MSAIKQIPVSDQKKPPLPLNDTKIPTNDHMPTRYQKKPSLPENDINMPVDYHNDLPKIRNRICLKIEILGKMLRIAILLR